MDEYLIIDGYNLLYALAQKAGERVEERGSLEEQRDELIARCQNYSALAGTKTVLVFDAYSQDSPLYIEDMSYLRLVYTGKDQTADAFIERYLYQLPRMNRKMVVTSDNAVQTLSMMTGAERIPSREFIGMLEEAEKTHKVVRRDTRTSRNHLATYMDDDSLDQLEKIRRGLHEHETPGKEETKKPKTRTVRRVVRKGASEKPKKVARLSDLEKLQREMNRAENRKQKKPQISLNKYELESLQKETRGKQISRREKQRRKNQKKSHKNSKTR